MVVVRVEVDDQQVALDGGVAARQLADDRARVAVAQLGGHVERVVVVREADPGVLAGGPALVGVALEESGGSWRRLPGGVVEAAVDLGRRRGADRGDFAGGSGLRPTGNGADGEGEQERGNQATT